ncbi:MAG: hypothetical protein WBW92_14085, partial [Rhodanobacteraceae bacterium]
MLVSDKARRSMQKAGLALALALLAGMAMAGSEGQLDPAFGPAHNGMVSVAFNVSGGLYDIAQGAAMQSGGRIIVAGRVQNGASQIGMGVMRLDGRGYADSSFGGLGTGQTTVFLSQTAKVAGVLVQPDDRIILYGTTSAGGSSAFFAMRLLADGSAPDPAWNGDGLVTVVFPGMGVISTAAVMDTTGHLFLAGYTLAGTVTNGDFAVAKLGADGNLDSSFGRRTVAFDLGGDNADKAEAVALQSDGKLVLAGEADIANTTSKFAVARLDAGSGALDSGFGNQAAGRSAVTIPGGFNGCLNQAAALSMYEVSSSQRTLLVGGTHCRFDVAATAAVAALDNAGQLINNFGSGGVASAGIYPNLYQSGEITAM